MTNTISCPVCENICSSQASSCPKCGHPLKQEVATKEPAPNGSNFTCPQCGSDQISTLQMVYSQGTSSGKVSAGTITGDGSFAFTGGNVNSQSVLARQVAPPRRPRMNGWIIYGIVILALIIAVMSISFVYSGLSFLIITFGVTGVGLYLYYLSVQKKMPDYWDELDHWEKGKICFRCGNTWFSSKNRNAPQSLFS